MKKQVAIFKDDTFTSFNFDFIAEVTDKYKNGVRVSEIVEVEFVERSHSDVLNDQLALLDEQIQSIKDESIKRIEMLSNKKAELQGLTYMEKGE